MQRRPKESGLLSILCQMNRADRNPLFLLRSCCSSSKARQVEESAGLFVKSHTWAFTRSRWVFTVLAMYALVWVCLPVGKPFMFSKNLQILLKSRPGPAGVLMLAQSRTLNIADVQGGAQIIVSILLPPLALTL